MQKQKKKGIWTRYIAAGCLLLVSIYKLKALGAVAGLLLTTKLRNTYWCPINLVAA